jgi:aconitate hydratase
VATRLDSYKSRSTIEVGGKQYTYYRVEAAGPEVSRLPVAFKILLENLLRYEDGRTVTKEQIDAIASWDPKSPPQREIAFRPARVLLQDFTGVPCVVDLAAMRDAMAQMGGDPDKINPLQDVELVIDHSVIADAFGNSQAFAINAELEFQRNGERYQLLKWAQNALRRVRVLPPDQGIVHQVNLEYLARVVFAEDRDGEAVAYPDTLVGTDSHTTMINGLGVLGWGVGGIEAEAAMLGQPVSMLVPEIVGFKVTGKMREGATATDLVLTCTEMLRKRGVVGKFVEFYGPGLSNLTLADRATVSNMCPEYGATAALFPIDGETLKYLRLTGRSADHIARVREYAEAQGIFRRDDTPEPLFTDTMHLDLAHVEPSIAGPRRPQDRVPLRGSKDAFCTAFSELAERREALVAASSTFDPEGNEAAVAMAGKKTVRYGEGASAGELSDGAVVIAAITSCTNTSNPSVLVCAGLLAKNAVARGLTSKPWVKTSLAPGSKVVMDYLAKADLVKPLEQLGFYLVGYGCTTCIGNSGPLPDPIAQAVTDNDLIVCSVLSGNRNFEGRVHPQVRANYLASPPLVVAYALAGRMDFDMQTEPLGTDKDGKPVYLRDLWPTTAQIDAVVTENVAESMFRLEYADAFGGDERWKSLSVAPTTKFSWDGESTYVKRPPYFEGMTREPAAMRDIAGARVLVFVGDSVTTDHISPAGSIPKSTPAGKYLIAHGVEPKDFNSYGARRGNHEVMMRGTFANVRLRNRMAPGTEGGVTRHLPEGEQLSIYDAAMRYVADGVPLIVLAGKEYGSGSSRDWAAKGPRLLGIRAAIAQSFERIHRSNLIGMGVLPLEFEAGQSADSLGLTGEETFDVGGIAGGVAPGARVSVRATSPSGKVTTFTAVARIDTPDEAEYYRHDGILPYVLRQLMKA